MRNIEMNYYNVYYYCNIIDNLIGLFTSSLDWVRTGAQFTEPFFEENPACFPKYSALHAFCEFAIRQLMFEDAEDQITEIQNKYNELKIAYKAKRLRIAFQESERGSCLLEVYHLFRMYGIAHETFFAYLIKNDFDDMVDAYSDFTCFDIDLDQALEKLTREVF